MTRMKESGIDWIGQIPEEWEVAKVNHIFEEHKQKNRGNKEKNLLSLSYGRIIRKSIDSSFGLLPESFDTYNIIQRGDIVLRLTDLQNDKRSLRVGLARENGIITSAYLTLRLKNLESNDSYMYYLLHTYDICKVFYNFGGGVRQGGTWSDIYKMELLIPPCNEQQKIADYLDKKTAQLDKAKRLLEKQIQKLKDYRASLIYETVTKGLDKTVPMKDSGIDWIGQVPEGWGVIKFKYLGDVKQGLTYSPSDIVDKDEGILVLRSGNIQNGILDFTNNVYVKTKVAESIVLRKNDILITARNGSPVLIGKNAIIDTDIKATFGAFMMVFRANQSLFAKFAFYLMNVSFNFYRTFFTTSTVNQLTAAIFNGIEVPLPSIYEQKKITDFLDEKTVQIDKLIQIKSQQINNINKQRQTLIYDYVTGKRRV
ncbi:restriction endonuclease subunit S [Streptococcus sanguinis]|uniref:restriction endonuclease subunit S n=1 Tax=Streptococcus sanguinis TaxID=1305 RepID=UPI000F67EE94|nr:restriction endonuclease subunit S [Streptococcus sanguinis]MCY7017454.1 restriction endonuclease subunit S [Streptococcus sanguinis]RSJ41786.1 Type-1 restriction enzyme EcoKI specificity protein [Streptococcus sanguinis]